MILHRAFLPIKKFLATVFLKLVVFQVGVISYEICRSSRRIKINDDEHVWKEFVAKKDEANPEFTKKYNSSVNSHLEDWFKDLL